MTDFLTINRFPGDGVTTDWNINFAGGYLNKLYVKAYIQDDTSGAILGTVTITEANFIGPNTVRITPATPAGQTTVIYRDTPKDNPLVDFTDGSMFTEANLDLLARQAIQVSAESADQVGTAAADAQTAANGAANSAAAAASSQAASAASQTSASGSATSAANSASAAAGSASAAASSKAAAASSASAAAASQTGAASSATSAANSASSASASAAAASTSATNAANSATTATTKASEASTSATNAASSASAAASSATAASGSASAASTSATNAATSATAALNSQNAAASSASAASTSATNAANSATAAAGSATSASNSATTATTQATNSANSASAASTSATNAANSATAASGSASAASTSATNAADSAAAAAAALDSFDDRYLGPKASDPTVDNDGNALLEGAVYWNTASKLLKVYNGTIWVGWPANTAAAVTFSPTGGVAATNVQTAIAELDTEKAPKAAPAFTGRGSAEAMDMKAQALGSGSGTRALDQAVANYFSATVAGATTFTFTNPPPAGYVGAFMLELTNGGSAAVTWPASVDWPGGTAPTLTAAGVDVLVFISDDQGTIWRGSVVQADSK